MKQLFFVTSWLLLSTGVIVTTIASYQFYLLYSQRPAEVQATAENPVKISLAEETKTQPEVKGEVKGVETILESGDGRAELVANFLKRHKSPLEPYDEYGQMIVTISDRYGIDFRLLPAIAMQESNLCKRIPEGSFNCLGFGVHSKGTLGFDSYEANFDRAARELKKNYIDRGLTTPELIMTKYTPGSNGSWAESVNQWMAEMRYDDRQMGKDSEVDANVLEFAQPTPASSPTTNAN